MTIDVHAFNANGYRLAAHEASRIEDAVAWMLTQKAAVFVDGYSVEGFGIVRVAPSRQSFTWLEGDTPATARFVEGDVTALTEALRQRVHDMPKRDDSAAAAAERVRLKRAARVAEGAT